MSQEKEHVNQSSSYHQNDVNELESPAGAEDQQLRKRKSKMAGDLSNDKKQAEAAVEAKFFLAENQLKSLSLMILTVHTTANVLLMRYVRSRKTEEMFLSSSSVVMSELIKFVVSLAALLVCEHGSLRMFARQLYEHILLEPVDCLEIAVPAVIYYVQNNLLYIALSNLDAATFQVTYQLKILTTAVMSVLLLNKRITHVQWVSLVMLFIGVGIVQLQEINPDSTTTHHHHNPPLGLLAVSVSCLLSAFAGVYFEKLLKSKKQSLWIRNIQLSFISICFGAIAMWINDGSVIKEKGVLHGYDGVVWGSVLVTSTGGLLIGVVVKYTDSILKGFSTSGAIVLSCLISRFMFDFEMTTQFTVGACLVVASVMTYSKFVAKV